AALGDLLEAVPDEMLSELSEPQRRAISVALLREEAAEGSRAEPRAVSMALLNVCRIHAVAGNSPVLVAIDDLQWLDAPSARAIEFAARRLESEPVGILASQRQPGGDSPLEIERFLADNRIERLTIGPLDRADLERVVRRRVTTKLSRQALGRIHRL